MSKIEDPGGGVQGESQIPFRSLATYLGCAEGYRIVRADQLPTTALGESD